MKLIYLCLAWVAGMMLARHGGVPLLLLLCSGAAGVVLALQGRRLPWGRWMGALLIATALGAGRYALATRTARDAITLRQYNDRGTITLYGYLSAEPTARGRYVQLEFLAEAVETEERRHPTRGKLVTNVPPFPAYEYGDALRLTGQLETPPVLADMDYREYLAARGVHSLLRGARVTRLPATGGSPLLRALYRIKAGLHQVIASLLPDPEAGLLAGILLGQGNALPADLAEAFRVVGLTHILVISGFNISMVSQAAMVGARRWLHRWGTLWLSLATVILYTVLVGPSAPVLRATLMGCLFVVGALVGRRSHAPTSLAAASWIMTATNPLTLWSVSFQLSFASTLALILVEPAISRRLRAVPAASRGNGRAQSWMRLLRDILLTSWIAQMATLPILWYHFQRISLISLLANALVLPVQPAIMSWGWGAMLLGTLWLPLGQIAAGIVWPLLRYTTLTVEVLANVPWASTRVPPLSPFAIVAFYALSLALVFSAPIMRMLGGLASKLKQKPLWRQIVIPALGLLVVLIWSGIPALPDGKLHVHVLDVGQGDAILLRSPQGHTVLIDGGPDPVLLASRLGKALPFWRRRIDLIVATHSDGDHLTGLIPALERYRVTQVVAPAIMEQSPLTREWQQALNARRIEPILAQEGMTVQMGGELSLQVLNPPLASASAQDGGNEDSIVLRVNHGQFHLLLTGDIDSATETRLMAQGLLLEATVLKVAHHGARAGTSEAFLAAVRPQVAIISVGKGNSFGHPDGQVLERLEAAGCRTLRTDRHGTISLTSDGRRYWVER